MAYPGYIREKARQLRTEKKLTIDEIAERLSISRTTIYYWVRDLPIPRKPANGWSESARRKGSKAMQAKYRALREAAYKSGKDEFRVLHACPTFRDFVCMYIGEGYKRDRNVVSICNSDPAVVRLGAHWIRRLTKHPIAFAFQYHADQDPADIRTFWGQLLDIEAAAIKCQRKSNSGKLNGRSWRSKHGVLQVRTADTYLRARLGAWMDCVRDEWP
jgi:hypothetical protein